MLIAVFALTNYGTTATLTPRNLQVSTVTWGDVLANPKAAVAVRELVMARMAEMSNLTLSDGIDACSVCTLAMPAIIEFLEKRGCGLLFDVRMLPKLLCWIHHFPDFLCIEMLILVPRRQQ